MSGNSIDFIDSLTLQDFLFLDEHVVKVDIRLHCVINFAEIHCIEYAYSNSGEKKLIRGENLQLNQAQCTRPSLEATWETEKTKAGTQKEDRSTEALICLCGKSKEAP